MSIPIFGEIAFIPLKIGAICQNVFWFNYGIYIS